MDQEEMTGGSKRPIRRTGSFPLHRCVMRFNDVYLDVLHKTLTDIYSKAVPVKVIIEGGDVKYIYNNETQGQIDYFKEEMIKRHSELAKPLYLVGA